MTDPRPWVVNDQEWIASIAREFAWSQVDIGQRAGLSPSHVSRVASGARSFSPRARKLVQSAIDRAYAERRGETEKQAATRSRDLRCNVIALAHLYAARDADPSLLWVANRIAECIERLEAEVERKS